MYIPKDSKNIAVLISGGIDSTLLLYLLVKEIKENGMDVRLDAITFRSGSVFPDNVKKVIKYIEEKFSVHIPYNDKAPRSWIRNVVNDIFRIYNSDYVYTGCNLVVENEFSPTIYLPDDTPPIRGEPLNERHLRPFIDHDKIQIVEEYIKNDILDLLKITHSCGIYFNKECGECYFCMEKIWATKKLKVNKMFDYMNNSYNTKEE